MNVQPFIKQGRIVWTMTTSAYKLYTLNLRKWLIEVAKVPWTLCIICCDQDSYTFCRRESVPCIFYKDQTIRKGQQGIAVFGSTEFKVWNRIKLDLLRWFAANALSLGIEWSLYLDGDIVVQQDPWPNLIDLSGNLFFQCDCGNVDPHDAPAPNCRNICSGVIATRHVSEMQADLYSYTPTLWKKSLEQDQPYIAERLKETRTSFQTLSRRLFGNGHWQQKGAWKEDDWVLLHYNYRSGDTKKLAMRAAKHWLLIGAS